MPFCPKCGVSVNDEDKFCYKCGYNLKQPTDNNDDVKSNNSSEKFKIFANEQHKNGVVHYIVFTIVTLICLFVYMLLYPLVVKDTNNQQSNNTKATSLTTASKSKQQKHKKVNPVNFDKYLVYKYIPHGIYVFKIAKSQFNKSDFLKYAQTIPKSTEGNTNFIFVFNDNISSKTADIIRGMAANETYNMPLYTTDILWKQYPYFFYSDAFGIKQSYCEINGLSQKYYERNQALLYDERNFSYKYDLTAPSMFGLSSLNGCNPEYTQDDLTINQEMELGTIFGINMR